MKIQIKNYTFDASAKTIEFTDYGTIDLDSVLIIANVTDGIIIYNFADASKGGAAATNILTLQYDTTAMSDADDLLIYYDDVDAVQSVSIDSAQLPADAATETKQDAGNTSLASIDSKLTNPLPISGTVTSDAGTNLNTSLLALETGGNLASIKAKTDNIPAQGQALAAASTPVVLPAAQITTLTPPAAITGFALEATLQSVKTALEVIDNFISGSKGLVTEDNSAAIKTAVEAINTANGAIADAIVAAGATGSISAKLRRVTQGLEDLKTLIVLGAGSAIIGKVGIDQTTPGSTNAVVPLGNVAHDAADSGNPLKIGGRARTSLITPVSNDDRIDSIFDTFGRQLSSHIDPAQQIWKQVEATSTQTGTGIWTPASGKKIAVTSLIITTGGTVAGVVTVWFGASGDTTYSQGSDQVVFRGEYAPSTTSRPFSIITPQVPFFAATADYILRYTTTANVTIYITAYGYEF